MPSQATTSSGSEDTKMIYQPAYLLNITTADWSLTVPGQLQDKLGVCPPNRHQREFAPAIGGAEQNAVKSVSTSHVARPVNNLKELTFLNEPH